MEKWEYLVVWMGWDNKTQEWKVQEGTKPPYTAKGHMDVLNIVGEQGWELLHVVPISYSASDISGYTDGPIIGAYWAYQFRAYFKHRKP